MKELYMVIILIFALLLWMLPIIVAFKQKQSRNTKGVVVLLTLFTSGTVVGWIVALVIASNEKKEL